MLYLYHIGNFYSIHIVNEEWVRVLLQVKFNRLFYLVLSGLIGQIELSLASQASCARLSAWDIILARLSIFFTHGVNGLILF